MSCVSFNFVVISLVSADGVCINTGQYAKYLSMVLFKLYVAVLIKCICRFCIFLSIQAFILHHLFLITAFNLLISCKDAL